MKTGIYCECGRPKPKGIEGCDRCRAIDGEGHHDKPSRIIGHRARQSGTSIVGRACDRFILERGIVEPTAIAFGTRTR